MFSSSENQVTYMYSTTEMQPTVGLRAAINWCPDAAQLSREVRSNSSDIRGVSPGSVERTIRPSVTIYGDIDAGPLQPQISSVSTLRSSGSQPAGCLRSNQHTAAANVSSSGSYRCRSYEDCCGSRCCVRALSIQRLWYFWFLLMMGVLFCCGAGFFIRRRMYPPPLGEEPTFNVSYTRQPANTAAGSQQPGMPYYTDPGGPVMNPMAMAFHVQPNSPPGNPVYPPPPSYCNAPPPPYEQVVKSST
ncbi:Vesicular, overexpressed in cancer, prosurvival protein 1 [Chelonia mydas]|uniref:WW domain binding protein VOPP1 n=1 Tax=Chelonia mydas TaxID=8469 RepID=M7BE13_CHEMY|nr:Vesicular, overexpressed in cancer, prosurvival protein 1 [Chelonia mydas]